MSYHTKYIKSTSSFMKKTETILQNNNCLLCYSKIPTLPLLQSNFWITFNVEFCGVFVLI